MVEGLSFNNSPPRRGAQEVLRAYSDNPQLQRVYGRIASSFAGIPWETFRVRNARGKASRSIALERAGFETRGPIMKRLQMEGQLEPIENDPLVAFLNEGNPALSGFECRELMQLHLDLVGECFARKERNAAGMPIRYWPIMPSWIRDVPSASDPFFELQVSVASENIPAEDMIWIKTPDPFRPYERGAGQGMALADEMATDEYTSQYIKTFFFNNASPEAIISLPEAGRAELRRLEAHWDQRNRGVQRSHRVHFLNQEAKVTPMTSDLRHIGLTDLRRFLGDMVRETPGVPPEIVGQIENSNRATIEAATFIFSRWVLVPRLDRWRDALQNQLVPDFDKANRGPKRQRVLSYHSPVPADREFVLKAAMAAPWSRSRAEWREFQDLEPNAADDVYLQPPNLVERPIDDVNWQPPQPENPFAQVRSVKKVSKAVDPTDAETLALEASDVLLTGPMKEFWDEELLQWGQGVLEEVGADVNFNMLNPAIVEYLDEFGAVRMTGVNATTQEAIRKTVAEAVREGEGYKDLARRISGVFEEARGWRANAIARTEPATAANLATYQAHKQSGLVMKREWVATRDGRTRESHQLLDGTVVGINENFIFSDGTPTVAPGQSGDPAQDIQCRCTTVAVLEDEENRASPDAVWKQFDGSLTQWEERTQRALAQAFSAQQADVEAKLRELAKRAGEPLD